MRQLTEGFFCGTWRSYKTILHSGGIVNHTKGNKYLEFNFADDKQLTISIFQNGMCKLKEEASDWTVILQNKRHYLQINGKRTRYEVITINHTALVIMNTETLEKFFCAHLQTWEVYLKSPSF